MPLNFSSTVPVSCDKGYQLHGDNNITCLSGGIWSNNTMCQVKSMYYNMLYGPAHVVLYKNQIPERVIVLNIVPQNVKFTKAQLKLIIILRRGTLNLFFDICQALLLRYFPLALAMVLDDYFRGNTIS